jgi:hypothetical protein
VVTKGADIFLGCVERPSHELYGDRMPGLEGATNGLVKLRITSSNPTAARLICYIVSRQIS